MHDILLKHKKKIEERQTREDGLPSMSPEEYFGSPRYIMFEPQQPTQFGLSNPAGTFRRKHDPPKLRPHFARVIFPAGEIGFTKWSVGTGNYSFLQSQNPGKAVARKSLHRFSWSVIKREKCVIDETRLRGTKAMSEKEIDEMVQKSQDFFYDFLTDYINNYVAQLVVTTQYRNKFKAEIDLAEGSMSDRVLRIDQDRESAQLTPEEKVRAAIIGHFQSGEHKTPFPNIPFPDIIKKLREDERSRDKEISSEATKLLDSSFIKKEDLLQVPDLMTISIDHFPWTKKPEGMEDDSPLYEGGDSDMGDYLRTHILHDIPIKMLDGSMETVTSIDSGDFRNGDIASVKGCSLRFDFGPRMCPSRVMADGLIAIMPVAGRKRARDTEDGSDVEEEAEAKRAETAEEDCELFGGRA